ncbi:hypothetical protein AWW66_09670 [Micromonospora rosaria]|uniref:Uncharacterized protein n=1 Tax=Micromonospora rosaria TaxID=47874 RepID=A0A136PUS6_9ACTN|nr:hypothetical protein [Micromonospora rosaria]KXK62182.1 hypothetical protein AWW66_09670 [Micromonospora rosaria]
MNDRLTDAFAEGERHTPDPVEVLAGVHAGIRRRRRHRRYATSGAAGIAVLALTAGIALLPADRGDPLPGSGPPPVVQEVPPQECRLHFDWLPEGLAERPARTCGPREQIVFYALVDGPYLSASIHPPQWRDRSVSTGWTETEVNGGFGQIATLPTRSFVQFVLPSGRWAELEYGHGRPGDAAQDGLDEIILRIARGVSEQTTETLRTPFALSYLPPGQHLAYVFTRNGATGVSYQDGSGEITEDRIEATTEDGLPIDRARTDDGTSYGIGWAPGAGDPHAMPLTEMTRLPDIQGRPAHLTRHGDTLIIGDFHGGRLSVQMVRQAPLVVPTEPPRPDPAVIRELTRIAEGVRWVG